jgi:GNAT superfamily N-acetyltransferase
MARAWIDGGRYYTNLRPEIFQVPDERSTLVSFSELMHGPDSRRVRFVAEIGNEVVGWISATVEQGSETADIHLQRDAGSTKVHINALMVDQDHRYQGVGTALMHHVEAWARSQEATMLTLDVFVGAADVVDFYERHLGYSRRSLRLTKSLTNSPLPTPPDSTGHQEDQRKAAEDRDIDGRPTT